MILCLAVILKMKLLKLDEIIYNRLQNFQSLLVVLIPNVQIGFGNNLVLGFSIPVH